MYSSFVPSGYTTNVFRLLSKILEDPRMNYSPLDNSKMPYFLFIYSILNFILEKFKNSINAVQTVSFLCISQVNKLQQIEYK